ncbi:MAG: tRNA (uridine(34)/cytosine(34)/5-carboxymethylaminomethyluridine(34)-2'-O)-methyltransferase TrmL [Candidatus Cloacimonetes bacterium]|nr:tRNA (uridine(34)/cytosine(34)/5-carboxymethylaminomethyluridine(34)-2'-O)-methyltransferase TrmL [Candidatus Cloacimonadota bacterium]
MAEHHEQISFRVVLYQPEIPANTGNIGRLCLGANAELHIIKPMRFFLNDKYLKRAGLDYWDHVKLFMHDSLDELIAKYPENQVYYCTTKSKQSYSDFVYKKGDLFVFGPESRGIPESILGDNAEHCITIPMHHEIRSINLSNSVSIILYEALRQINFDY